MAGKAERVVFTPRSHDCSSSLYCTAPQLVHIHCCARCLLELVARNEPLFDDRLYLLGCKLGVPPWLARAIESHTHVDAGVDVLVDVVILFYFAPLTSS